MTTAWAAYFAQFNMLNQGAQPAAAGMSYGGQPGLLGPAGGPAAATQQMPHMNQQAPAAPATTADMSQQAVAGAGGQPDYSDQWIAYYRANGCENYAQAVIEMKKQAQQQQQQSQ